MSKSIEIFVSLLDEGVEVWRPVLAEHVDGAIYRIVFQPYNREVETWEYEPGDEVVCKMIDSSDGQILAATRRA
jgi:hypothetical protein